MTPSLPLLLQGCVLSVSGTTTFDEPIDRVVLDVSKGDIRITAAPGPITLAVDFAGLGSSEVGHTVADGVLTIDYACGGPQLCGGDLELTVPARTAVEVGLGAGDVDVMGLHGDLLALLGAGSVRVEDHGRGPVQIVTGAGEAQLSFSTPPDVADVTVGAGSIEIELPGGSYALDLQARGSVDVDPAVVADPSSEHGVIAEARAGSIEITAR